MTRMNERIEHYFCDRNVEVSKPAEIIGNSAHVMDYCI